VCLPDLDLVAAQELSHPRGIADIIPEPVDRRLIGRAEAAPEKRISSRIPMRGRCGGVFG